jgi:hypothetical protein
MYAWGTLPGTVCSQMCWPGYWCRYVRARIRHALLLWCPAALCAQLVVEVAAPRSFLLVAALSSSCCCRRHTLLNLQPPLFHRLLLLLLCSKGLLLLLLLLPPLMLVVCLTSASFLRMMVPTGTLMIRSPPSAPSLMDPWPAVCVLKGGVRG